VDATANVITIVLLLVLMTGTAAVTIGVTARAASGKLKPNQWVGMRMKTTMQSAAAWQAAHQAAMPMTWLILPVTVIADAALVAALVGVWSPTAYLYTLTAILWGAAIVALAIAAIVVGNRAAKNA